ncbi:MIF4G-domain-containing protein [Pisolithus marmoratus]|nr:MIF4G-domain-containing protein [Pisolithus marmoratus]
MLISNSGSGRAATLMGKSSQEYPWLSKGALCKTIVSIINQVDVANIKQVMKVQAASLPFSLAFAALVVIINTKLLQEGELVSAWLISQYNNKIVYHSSTAFIAHLVNQAVTHKIIALEMLIFLLEHLVDDSIEIVVGFMCAADVFLVENSPKANALVFRHFCNILNKGTISHHMQYMIEVLMQVQKDKYKDNPIIPEGLDLMEEEELQVQGLSKLFLFITSISVLNVCADIFRYDTNYMENEEEYKVIKAEILGEGSKDESGSEESSKEEEKQEATEEQEGILDQTGTNLLLKIQLKEGEEASVIVLCCPKIIVMTAHLINMIIECCLQDDAISWVNLGSIEMNEDDMTLSSHISIKIMMEEVMESMGLKALAEQFKDEEIKVACKDMFPMDNPKNTHFSIHYFTSMRLDIVMEEMREYLKNTPCLIMEQCPTLPEQESSSSDSDSLDDSAANSPFDS